MVCAFSNISLNMFGIFIYSNGNQNFTKIFETLYDFNLFKYSTPCSIQLGTNHFLYIILMS